MKKLVSILIAMIMVISLMPMTVFAGDPEPVISWNNIQKPDTEGTVNAYLYANDADPGTYTLKITGTGDMDDFNSASLPWKSQKSSITDVEVAEGVTNIGNYAFSQFDKLKNVKISASVKSIGQMAFFSSNVKNVEIAESSQLTTINDYAFVNCLNLKSITIPASVTSIGNQAFNGCTELETLTFAEGSKLTSINSTTFQNCSKLKGVTIPAKVETIGSNAFKGCKELETLTFAEGSTLKTIGKYAFQKCEKLTSVVIPDTAEDLALECFEGCASLTEVAFPSSVMTKQETSSQLPAFFHCPIKKITVDNVVYENEMKFEFTHNLDGFWNIKTSLDSDTQVSEAIEGKTYSFTLGTQLNAYLTGSYTVPKDTEVTIVAGESSSTKVLKNDVNVTVCSLRTLADAIDPPPVGEWDISKTAGTGNVWAKLYKNDTDPVTYTLKITGTGEMKNWGFSDSNEWHNDDYKSKITDVEIGDGVENIGENAFVGHARLKNVKISASVKKIGFGAFQSSGVESVEIAESSQLASIEGQAFWKCESLTDSFTIPASVEEIKNSAFLATGVTNIVFEDDSKLTKLGNSVFQDCTHLTSVSFGANSKLQTIDNNAFKNTGLTSITIPASVETIGANAFFENKSLQSVIFEEGASQILSVGDCAFQSCTNLETLVLSTSVKSLTASFRDCSKLSNVTVPSSVEILTNSAGYSVFAGCDAITKTTIDSVNYTVPSDNVGKITLGKSGDSGTIKAPSGTIVSTTIDGKTYSFTLGAQLVNAAEKWTDGTYSVPAETVITIASGEASNTKALENVVNVKVKDLQPLIDVLDRPEVRATEVTANSIKLTYNANWEYKCGDDSWNSGENANVFSNLTPATKYTFNVRVKDREGTKVTVTQYTAHSAPGADEVYFLDYSDEIIIILEDYEVFSDAELTTSVATGDIITPGATYYVRKAATGDIPASAAISFVAPDRAPTPDAPTVVSKTDTTIKVNTVDGQEYSIDNGTTWQKKGEFTGLIAGKEYTIYTRVKAVTTPGSEKFASEKSAALSVTTKSVPDAPDVTAADATVTANSITLPTNGTPNAYEYSTDNSTWNDIYEFTGLTAATQYTYYIRYKETNESIASAATELKIYSAHATPGDGEGYSIDYATEEVIVDDGYEISKTADPAFSAETLTENKLAITPNTTYYIRKAATEGGAPASACKSFTTLERPATPSAPELSSKTDTSITVVAATGQEYSIDDGSTWVAPEGETVVFSNLTANTSYSIITRVEAVTTEGSEKFASANSEPLTVTTEQHKTSGGGSSSYSVTTKSSKNGTIAIDKKKAASGSTVTITVKPDSGFTVEKVTVLDKNGKEVTVKNLGNNKYSFTMPKGGVTVSATFMEDNTMLNFFVDVKASDYFYDAVLWAAENGITTGTDAIHFSPNGTTTRAQMVTFIWRLAGSPDFEGGDTPFTDITKSDYFYDAVVWGWNVGIINGKSENLFAPDDIVTRGEAVTFIYRYAKVAGGDLPNPFTDVTLGKFYYYPVLWAANNEIVKGTSSTTFSPDAECTRGQVVTFLYRYNNQYSIQ